MQAAVLSDFLTRHQLDEAYLEQASIWFAPVVEQVIKHHNSAKETLVIGINGSQGSGKTTLADYLSVSFQEHGLRCVSISIDDFYLKRSERETLSEQVHPLLLTRGVPGTHDLELASQTIESLKHSTNEVLVPRFNKATDDRFETSMWPRITAPVDIIILEGWCVGIPAQPESALSTAINTLESDLDPSQTWRRYVNQLLASHYQKLWEEIDCLIMLAAPSFERVYGWRLEQEEKLQKLVHSENINARNKIMSPAEIERFIQHYQRLTEHALKVLPARCHHVFNLNGKRQIQKHSTPNSLVLNEAEESANGING